MRYCAIFHANLNYAFLDLGEMVTFKECCEMEPVDAPYFVEDRFAWHRTYADAWASTPESLRYDPVISGLRGDYKDNVQAVAESRDDLRPLAEEFWFHLTNAENSDGRWPPPPAETCPFNREWVEKQIDSARNVLAERDKGEPESGRRKIEAIYAEYVRRGATSVAPMP